MGWLKRLLGFEEKAMPKGCAKKPLNPVRLQRTHAYDYPIVGESFRQETLATLCGGKCEEGHALGVTAQLLLEENNPYDPNAVAVFIEREHVGYIPREDAPDFRQSLLRISPNDQPVTCHAVIVGGWKRDAEDEGDFGVRLSLRLPLQAASSEV